MLHFDLALEEVGSDRGDERLICMRISALNLLIYLMSGDDCSRGEALSWNQLQTYIWVKMVFMYGRQLDGHGSSGC